MEGQIMIKRVLNDESIDKEREKKDLLSDSMNNRQENITRRNQVKTFNEKKPPTPAEEKAFKNEGIVFEKGKKSWLKISPEKTALDNAVASRVYMFQTSDGQKFNTYEEALAHEEL